MTECVEGPKTRDRHGYPVRRCGGGKRVRMHRLRFYEVFGWWPAVVRHTCDNRACINPWHLLPGTQTDNMRDMAARGRGRNQHTNRNIGMPDRRLDAPGYFRERSSRIREGTWLYAS